MVLLRAQRNLTTMVTLGFHATGRGGGLPADATPGSPQRPSVLPRPRVLLGKTAEPTWLHHSACRGIRSRVGRVEWKRRGRAEEELCNGARCVTQSAWFQSAIRSWWGAGTTTERGGSADAARAGVSLAVWFMRRVTWLACCVGTAGRCGTLASCRVAFRVTFLLRRLAGAGSWQRRSEHET